MKLRIILISIVLAAAAWGQACKGTPDPRTWSGTWAGGTTFASCNVVFYAPNSSAYVSLQGGNLGNEPDTSPTWWTLLYGSPVFLQSTTPLQGSQIALDYNFAYALNAQPASVPYTGATGNVNLGTHSLTAQALTLAPSFLMSVGAGSTGGNFFLGSGGQTNTTGTYNAGAGFDALFSNTTGEYNSATGSYSLYSNTSGASNTASGAQALFNNTSGGANTGLGLNALFSSTTANFNTSVGGYSLYNNTTGASNSAVGHFSLYNNTTCSFNTGIGRNAGQFLRDGSTINQTPASSVYVGYNVEAYGAGDANEIVIGANAIGLGNNTAQVGDASVTTLGVGTVSWSHGTGAPGGTCVNGSIYTATNGTTTGLLWVCGSSTWQSIK
jgi:hypothetical protein